ncbi:MAG: PGPGW domain-containing protein [Pseudomonadota bacterium]
MLKRSLAMTYQTAKRLVIAVVGFSVVLVGVIMIVTPGPAFVVIPAGLAILSLEFAFARRWLRLLRERISRESQKLRSRRAEERRA